MINQVYTWLFEYFFAGELPAVLAPIAEELCSVGSLIVTAFAFAPVVGVIVLFLKFLSSCFRW